MLVIKNNISSLSNLITKYVRLLIFFAYPFFVSLAKLIVSFTHTLVCGVVDVALYN